MDLQFQLDTLRSTRANVRKVLDAYSHEEINKVPAGYNNNLIWNYGHIIVTQQLLCYKLAGVPMYIEKEMVKKYAKGTKPEGESDPHAYATLKELDQSTITKFEEDYAKEIFSQYNAYTTSYGITLDHIDKAFAFNNVHEGHHFGNILSMRKLL